MKIIVFVKRNLFAIVFLLFVIFLVVFSNSSLLATKKGLNLWANNVVPSLFPFLVAAQLLSHTNFIYYLSKLCNSYMKPLFNVPGIGAFVGAYVNNKLVDKLGEYAMYAYRMRILSDEVCVTKKTRWFSKIFIK